MNKKKNTTQGIVLLEAIVAISVLALIFTSSLQLFRSSIVGVRGATDTFVASELAQDVAEFLIAKRMENISHIGNSHWKDGLTCGTGDCSIDTLATSVTGANMITCAGVDACLLYVNSDKEYTYNSTGSVTQSPYTRKIQTELTDSNKQLKITTTVSWDSGSHTERYVLTTFLYAP